MSIICPTCKTDNPETKRFCGECGTQLTRHAEASPALTKTLETPVQALKKGSFLAKKYRIIDEIGRGGMGVVYRAHDESIDRDVAIKVLPPQFASDADRLRRFEQEARAAGQLNHPNILVVYEVGTHEGAPYIITELLEGEGLRDRLRAGSLPARKAVETTVQIAQGLAAAHEKHIIHRDLKPENVFMTKDGHVKILDFGLAKLAATRSRDEIEGMATLTETTEAGAVLGTVGYMSPEQVLGKPLDPRSDLFSLGIMFYEMLSGKRPFHKGSAPETMAAILKEEPPDLAETGENVPPGLDHVVRHCLEKEPSSRFQSARDIAFVLESLSQKKTTGAARPWLRPGKRRLAIINLGVILLAGSYAGLFLLARRPATAPVPSFKRITFRRGTVQSARFAPDFQSVVYSAAWDGKPAELFVQRFASADARSLGVVDRAITIAGTAGGEVTVLRADGESTLTQLPLEGGSPRDLLKGIFSADWDRSRNQFAVVRLAEGRRGERLEYPIGKVLVEVQAPQGIAWPRVSPDGTRIAFILTPSGSMNYAGDICLVDLEGRKRTLSKNWIKVSEGPLAWSPDGNEIWFSASRTWSRNELHAVTLSGKERLVTRLPGNLILEDIAPDGRALFVFGQTRRVEMRGRMAGDTAERDLPWLDFAFWPILAPDGSQMVFQYGSEAQNEFSTYHWRMDGSTPRRLGYGQTVDVSPDWTIALVGWAAEQEELKLVPIGAGETRTLPRGPIQTYGWAYWHPDGKRIIIIGYDAGGLRQMFVQNVSDGLPRPVRRLESSFFAGLLKISPDGRFITIPLKNGEPFAFYPVDGGEAEPIPYLRAGEIPLAFGDDGKSIFVTASRFAVSALVTRLDLTNGKREPWLELAPPDRTGVFIVGPVRLTVNGRYYAYNIHRLLSDLYLADGLK